MQNRKLHIAKVIDNVDPTKKGLVKIYIPYMHKDIKESFLPWALPFNNFTGGSSNFGASIIPEKDSHIWIFFEDEEIHKNPFYVGNVNNEDTNPNQLFETNIKSTVGSEGVYPDVKFIYTTNGICIAITTTSSTPEITVFHPNAYLFIDKNGYTYYEDAYSNKIKIDNTGFRFKDTKNNEIKTEDTKLVINGNLEISQ